jgi:hypothetical protein
LSWNCRFENLDLKMKEVSDVRPEEERVSEKRLARGLEDVSHLFVSQPSAGPSTKPPNLIASPKFVSPESAPPNIAIPLDPHPAAVDRESLISLLKTNAGVLEKNMRAIDVDVPCNPYGTLDMLALDRFNHFSIINIDTAPNDYSLLLGIGCSAWIAGNSSILKRMYPGRPVDFSAPPRLFLVAPDFSPLLACAAQYIAAPKVCCFRYRAATVADCVGILFEKV